MKIRSHLYLLAVGAIAPLLAASVIAGIFLVQHERATVSVRDEGIGITPHMLPRVFDMFAQAEGAAIRAQGGMGIGLALTDLHGGTVEARSEGVSGKGSEFIVRLPAVFPYDAEGPADRRAGPSGTGTSRFLVADDLADSADSLALLLRQYGHEVHTAYDGAQAFAA